MKLINVGTNYEAPFIAIETISRVCTNKLTPHINNICYNMKYNSEAQLMNSIKFVLGLVKLGHLSILDHVQISLEYAVKKSDDNEVAALLDISNLSEFNLKNNTAVNYKVYKDIDTPLCHEANEEPFIYLLRLEMNLRTLTEMALAKGATGKIKDKSADLLGRYFRKHIINMLLMRKDDLAIYLYLLEEDSYVDVLISGAYASDHIRDLFMMTSMNTTSDYFIKRFMLPPKPIEDQISNALERQDHLKHICKNSLIITETVRDSMEKITVKESDSTRITTDDTCISAKLINANYLMENITNLTADTIVSFVITGPMPILEQLLRHDTELGITKLSGRYTSFQDNKVYIRGGVYRNIEMQDMKKHFNNMDELIESMEKINEIDRLWQPLGSMSLMIWSKPLRLIIPFLKERLAPAAQYEVRIVAGDIFNEINEAIPEFIKIWCEIEGSMDYPVTQKIRKGDGDK